MSASTHPGRTRWTVATLAVGLFAASLAEAGHRRSRPDPLLRLAIEVERSATNLHRDAVRAAHYRHGRLRATPALDRLYALEHQARDFRLTLARFGPFSHRVERELDQLRWMQQRARRPLRFLDGNRRIRRDLARFDAAMIDLIDEFHYRVAYDQPRRGGPRRSSVRIEKRGKRGRASVGFSWRD